MLGFLSELKRGAWMLLAIPLAAAAIYAAVEFFKEAGRNEVRAEAAERVTRTVVRIAAAQADLDRDAMARLEASIRRDAEIDTELGHVARTILYAEDLEAIAAAHAAGVASLRASAADRHVAAAAGFDT